MKEIKSLAERSSSHLNESVRKIKTVCSEYFLTYETSMEEMRIRAFDLEQKFKEWSKVLIEPATLNDARLYALEARLQEEEDIRIMEFNFLRDLTRKLIYSLEQKDL